MRHHRDERNRDSGRGLLWQSGPLIVLFSLSLLVCPAASQGCVLVVDLDDTITPASDDIIAEAIAEAEEMECQALMVVLDTPGGGLAETTEITRLIERTDLPVIGYVYPPGATAWSAGTIILLSTDVAAMAPNTIIGSAQPVQIGPTGAEPVNDSKIINAMVALAEEKARMHQRNVTAAREFVVSNLNLNAETALDHGVIDLVSPNPASLLEQVDGLLVKNRTLSTKNAEIIRYQPSPRLLVQKILSDPLLAGLLVLVGLYALVFGLSNPGLGAELLGVIVLTLGLIGLGFSVNIGAVFLLLLGLGLILMELNSPGFGIFGMAGLICLIAGSVLLVPISSPEWSMPADYKQRMLLAMMAPSAVIGAFFVFALYKVAEARRRPPSIGKIVGEEAEALDRIDPRGHVMFNGEYWVAESAESEEVIEPGEVVVIVGKERTRLKVRKK